MASDDEAKTAIIEQLSWQLRLNAALAELYKPLISPGASIEAISNVILEQAKHLTGSEHGYVAYIDPESKDMVACTLTEMLENCCDVEGSGRRITFPLGKDGRYPTLWGHCLNNLEAFYTNTPHLHPTSVGTPSNHIPLERFLSVPVVLGDRLVGQIALAKPGRDYTDSDLSAIQKLGEYYALAIQHRRAEEAIRRSEEQLHQNEELFRMAFSHADIGFALLTPRGKWVRVNQKSLDYLQYTREELFRKTFKEISHPEDYGIERKYMLQMIKGEITTYTIEKRFLRKDGTPLYTHLKVSLSPPVPGKPRYVIAVAEDISRRIEMEKELHLHRERLEELVEKRSAELSTAHERLHQAEKMEAIGTLAGGIAHDFNNVLGAIIGYTELALLDIQAGSITQKNLDQVLAAASRARDMVKQILAFSRKENKERQLVSLAGITREAVRFLRSTLPTTIEIFSDIQDSLGPVLANPTQLHQVIINICTNAAHAMKDKGGLLKIGLKDVPLSHDHEGDETGEAVPQPFQKLSISDTGVGMPPDILERIFDPYFTTKDVGEGTGMGLAVVHGIVKSLNGDIIVKSSPGQGTTMDVFLPTAREKTPGDSPPPPPKSIPGKGERILFVDDEQILADMGKRMLEKLGYRVTAHISSVSALLDFRKASGNFDLMVVDMTMPKMTGIQLTEAVKVLNPGLPVILCTGFSNLIDEKNFQAQGIDSFLMKPIIMSDLAKKIRDLLDKKPGQKPTPP